jgi:AFG3 family protein
MGYSQFLPDQVSLYSKQELLDKISCALAGKVAEELVLKQITDSSMADLDKAKKIANAMVTRYGMSEVISNIGYPDSEIIKKPYSSILAEKIDDEVHRIITT